MKRLGKPFPSLGSKQAVGTIAADIAPKTPKGDLGLAPTRSKRDRLEAAAGNVPTGTLPERIIANWLAGRGILFTSQTPILGGALHIGGSVVDFILPTLGPPPGTALRVQGSYWHSLFNRQAKDALQQERLTAQGYTTVDAWETEVYDAVLGGYLDDYLIGLVYG